MTDTRRDDDSYDMYYELGVPHELWQRLKGVAAENEDTMNATILWLIKLGLDKLADEQAKGPRTYNEWDGDPSET